MASPVASRLLAPVGTTGKLFAFFLDVCRQLPRRPFQLREFLQQGWFIASVTIIPTALVAIPRDFKVKLIPREPGRTEECLQATEARTKEYYKHES